MSRRIGLGVLVLCLAVAGARRGLGQGPTVPGSPSMASEPGSTASSLGPGPGAGAVPFGDVPGTGANILGGRLGPSSPRVPTSITNPNSGVVVPMAPRGVTPPARLPIAIPPNYGSLDLPSRVEEEGPAGGLTLDAAIERLVRENAFLRVQSFEIPSARADVLTAGLRANPIVYADSQLNLYGGYRVAKPGGPNQYDVNISHPVDLSRKRLARRGVAVEAARVVEAQYQDAVRLQIDNLYNAYVNVLAARETTRFARASVEGLAGVREATATLFRRGNLLRPDLTRVEIQRGFAESGLRESEASLARDRRALATLLNYAPGEFESIELRGTIAGPLIEATPPTAEELARIALRARPDLRAYRLGIRRAEADVRLARANRFGDVYALYQPYTLQNNSPLGLKSPTSWALGVTVPVPVANRNQGNIQRSLLNVDQSHLELGALEQLVVAQVYDAEREQAASRATVEYLQQELIPSATRMRDEAFRLFRAGEMGFAEFSRVRAEYNDAIRGYRDALVRHRRSMLALNTAVGERVLP